MKKILLLFVALLGSTMLFAEGRVVRDTFHYATHDGQELYLDRYMTEVAGEELSPVMIFAFGGGFVGGERDREYYADYFRRLAEAGIVAVSIDYRLGLKSIPEGIGLIDMIGISYIILAFIAHLFDICTPSTYRHIGISAEQLTRHWRDILHKICGVSFSI